MPPVANNLGTPKWFHAAMDKLNTELFNAAKEEPLPADFDFGVACARASYLPDQSYGSIDKVAVVFRLRKETVTAFMRTKEKADRYKRATLSELFAQHEGLAGYARRALRQSAGQPRRRMKLIEKTLRKGKMEWLKCPVMMDIMKEPSVLPCGHTFEKSALTRLTRGARRTGDCPSCRESFSIHDIQHNFALNSAVQWFNKLPKATRDYLMQCDEDDDVY